MADIKTKKPTGLAIKREGNKFTLSWKQGESGIGSQTLQYRLKTLENKKGAKAKWGKWTAKSVGKSTTSKNLTINPDNYYPNSKKPKLNGFQFRICNKKATDSKGQTYSVSDWNSKTFNVKIPNKVKSCSQSLTAYNQTKFSWTLGKDDTAKEWLTNAVWQSILLKNSDAKYDKIKSKFKSSNVGWKTGTVTADGSQSIAEDFQKPNISGTYVSYTRWFRILAKGPQGDAKKYNYTRHVYARPYEPMYKNGKAKKDSAGDSLNIFFVWKLKTNDAHPVDTTMVTYYIGVPTGDNLKPPTDGWTQAPGGEVKDLTKKYNSFSCTIPQIPTLDQCLWMRAEAQHDEFINYGNPIRLYTAKLKPPTSLSLTNIDHTTHRITVNVTHGSEVPDSRIVVKYTDNRKYTKGIYIGLFGHDETSKTIQCPDWGTGDPSISVFSYEGTFYTRTKIEGDVYKYTPKNELTRSEELTNGGDVPVAPKNPSVDTTDIPGTINVSWEWSWRKATFAELSWADHNDAWNSTDEPSTYIVNNTSASTWNISGLESGKTWYVRIRLAIQSGDSVTYGPYCPIMSIDLSSSPDTPALTLSQSYINPKGTVTAAWGYASTDGTLQAVANIALVTIGEGQNTYRTIARATTSQHLTLSARKYGWQSGQTYNLAVQVGSGSGKMSGWSDHVSVLVADPITASVEYPDQNAKLETLTIEVDEETHETRTITALRKLPLVVQARGAGAGGKTVVTIERAETYHVERPDESEFDGNVGETIYSFSQNGEALISINPDDLVGSLDDSAQYNLVISVTDTVGQKDTLKVPFEVYWDHQAVIPENSVATLQEDKDVVFLDPVAPAGTQEGDVCDIYRLSVDKPELIYSGAQFGVRYVDPYPTIGKTGGYRFVFRTKYGDYIDANNVPAWIDIPIEYKNLNHIIDFGTDKANLLYNVDLSSSWTKDFKETKYLGGSVQGDWNPAVSRTGSINSVAIIAEDAELIRALRRLAVYAGVCHVRTRDGSNYAADVQVSESRGHEPSDLIASFTLNVTRVDPEDPDGMTYADWINMQEEE